MTDACERFRNDPESEPRHPEACVACREHAAAIAELEHALAGGMDSARAPLEITTSSLPVAPWEGAKHRPWPLVIMVALLLPAAAAALFAMDGVSPLDGFSAVFRAMLPHEGWLKVTRSFALAVRQAPQQIHIGVALAFLAVNALLYILMRRSLKGYDVGRR